MTSSQQREQAVSDISRMWGQLGISERYLSRDLFAAASKWASSAFEMQWEAAPKVCLPCMHSRLAVKFACRPYSNVCKQPLE